MGTYSSVTRSGATEPFELQVARGQIQGHSVVSIFGYQSAVGIGTPITVWENLVEYVYPTVASTMTVVSTSASDGSSLSVLINGLDANFNLLSEVIALNGLTNVTTVNSFFRINSIICTNGNNVGVITVKQSANILAQINAGVGRSQAALYTVPAGYSLFVRSVYAYSNEPGSGSNYSNYRVQINNRLTGASYTVLQTPFAPTYVVDRVLPFQYFEKNDVRWQTSVGTSTSPIGVIIQAYLIKNPD